MLFLVVLLYNCGYAEGCAFAQKYVCAVLMVMFFHHIDNLNQEWERRVLEEKCSVEQLQACHLEVNFLYLFKVRTS